MEISTISGNILPKKTEPSKGCLGSLWGAVKRITNSNECLETLNAAGAVLAVVSGGLLIAGILGAANTSIEGLVGLGAGIVLVGGVAVACVRMYRSDQRREKHVNALLKNSEKRNDNSGYFELV